jgi:hypothetical protein
MPRGVVFAQNAWIPAHKRCFFGILNPRTARRQGNL